FKGMAALAEESRRGPKERLVPLLLEEAGDADAPSCATVWQNGSRVGLLTTAGYGHSLGRSIALAYLRSDPAKPETPPEIEIPGERGAAIVASEPVYDPENSRLRM